MFYLFNSFQSNNSTAFAEFAMVPSAIFWGFVSDWLINNNYITRTANRKYFGFFGTFILNNSTIYYCN